MDLKSLLLDADAMLAELRGAGYHTLGEYIEVDSLAERARLMAGLLMALR